MSLIQEVIYFYQSVFACLDDYLHVSLGELSPSQMAGAQNVKKNASYLAGKYDT